MTNPLAKAILSTEHAQMMIDLVASTLEVCTEVVNDESGDFNLNHVGPALRLLCLTLVRVYDELSNVSCDLREISVKEDGKNE